jgi:hypothetical protein
VRLVGEGERAQPDDEGEAAAHGGSGGGENGRRRHGEDSNGSVRPTFLRPPVRRVRPRRLAALRHPAQEGPGAAEGDGQEAGQANRPDRSIS